MHLRDAPNEQRTGRVLAVARAAVNLSPHNIDGIWR